MARSAVAQGFGSLRHAGVKTRARFGGYQVLLGAISASALRQLASFLDSAEYLQAATPSDGGKTRDELTNSHWDKTRAEAGEDSLDFEETQTKRGGGGLVK